MAHHAQRAEPRGCYVYAIVPSGTAREGVRGIDGMPVYTVERGPLAAVVSDTDAERLRPERRRLAAHQAVLRDLMRETTVLPLAFGVVTDGPAAVERILEGNGDALGAQFERVRERVEMGLRIRRDVSNIFEHFVAASPRLRAARERLRDAGRDEMIAIGRMFEEVLEEDRDRHATLVANVLGEACSEVKRLPARNEREVGGFACLVERRSLEGFETAVAALADLLDDSFVVEMTGPWAPHNFVDVRLSA